MKIWAQPCPSELQHDKDSGMSTSLFDIITVIVVLALETGILAGVVATSPQGLIRRVRIIATLSGMTIVIWVFGFWLSPGRGASYMDPGSYEGIFTIMKINLLALTFMVVASAATAMIKKYGSPRSSS